MNNNPQIQELKRIRERGRKRVKVKDLKPKRIKDYLEYKFSQRSPALLKELNSSKRSEYGSCSRPKA
ncbi:hypothetical protein GQ457_08G022210 [Hibiscus cannabinus]